jgi:hypothetical protein
MNVRSLSLWKILHHENLNYCQSVPNPSFNPYYRLCYHDFVRLWCMPVWYGERFLLRHLLFYRARNSTFISGAIYLSAVPRSKNTDKTQETCPDRLETAKSSIPPKWLVLSLLECH